MTEDNRSMTLEELKAKIDGPIAALHLVHCGGRRAGIGDRINEVYDQVKTVQSAPSLRRKIL